MYKTLRQVQELAFEQAANGKGRDRHVKKSGEFFENQQICEMARRLSIDGPLYQAVKKIYEAAQMVKSDQKEAAGRELLGAMNYIAAAYIVLTED